MKKFAVIVAGGSGQRMRSEMPKQFLLLNAKPLLWYSVQAFLNAYDDMQIIIVLPQTHLNKGEEFAALLPHKEKIFVTTGGDTRFHSVQNGLKLVQEDSIVFVHDAVRCLLTAELVQRCYEQALQKGSAIPAVAATDSIRIAEGEKSYVASRQQVRLIQTPQTFLSGIILPAFEQEYKEAFTDEATVVEAYGTEVFLIEGEYDNMKITRPIDLLIAEKIIADRLPL